MDRSPKRAGHPQVGIRSLVHLSQAITDWPADTYTTSDLKRMSLHCLRGYASTSKLVAALRDRCMLLLSAYTAFRGDSARMLLLSDIGAQDVNMPEIAEGATVMVRTVEIQIYSKLTVFAGNDSLA